MYMPSGIEIQPPNPSGLCFCGCGQKAPIATQSNFVLGILKDHPMRFIHNHHMRKYERYLVEDRGYKTPCWIWQLAINEDGYGQTRASTGNMAHRAYYERHIGPIPSGTVLDHLCRVRCCVNPNHLEPVTSLENTRRGLNCKLRLEDIPVIRALRETGRSFASIAKEYGVTTMTIYHAVIRKTWRDI